MNQKCYICNFVLSDKDSIEFWRELSIESKKETNQINIQPICTYCKRDSRIGELLNDK